MWTVDLHGGAARCRRAPAAWWLVSVLQDSREDGDPGVLGVSHGIVLAPIFDIADLVEDRQLAARDYWTEVAGVKHPGPFAYDLRDTRQSRRRPRSAPPAVRVTGTPGAGGATSGLRSNAFEGLKVADFAWVGVGPIIGKALADHGATVVHVESMTRPDVLRTAAAVQGRTCRTSTGPSSWRTSTPRSSGSRLDLAQPGGPGARAQADRLGGRRRRELHAGDDGAAWARVRRRCAKKTPGPHHVEHLPARPDRPAAHVRAGSAGRAPRSRGCTTSRAGRTGRRPGPGARTRTSSPRASACVSSPPPSRGSRPHGQGQHIDLSQVEAGIHFMEPLVLDYTVNGRVTEAQEDRNLYSSPNGVFEVVGQGRYVALGCETPAQWRALRGAVAPLAPFGDASFDDLAVRQANADVIDAALRPWFADKDPWKVTADLQAAGVPISVVEFPSDLYEDPQLIHRGFFVTLDHAKMGPTPYDGLVSKFSGMPVGPLGPGPALGRAYRYGAQRDSRTERGRSGRTRGGGRPGVAAAHWRAWAARLTLRPAPACAGLKRAAPRLTCVTK